MSSVWGLTGILLFGCHAVQETKCVYVCVCIKANIRKLAEITLSPTFPKDHPEREASGGAILRPCWRIPIMFALFVPYHSRWWLPGTPQLANRSASPERETLKTALISKRWCPPKEKFQLSKQLSKGGVERIDRSVGHRHFFYGFSKWATTNDLKQPTP